MLIDEGGNPLAEIGLALSMAFFSLMILMLVAGFFAPLPYNYWRLKALGKACH